MESGPKFIRFFWPILSALRELGGSAKPREVIDFVLDKLEVSDDERAERTKSGTLRVDNQVHWARNYLVWAGYLDGSQRGRWALTNAGWALSLEEQDHQSAHGMFKRVRSERAEEWGKGSQTEHEDDTDPEEPPKALDDIEAGELSLASELRSTVLGLSPAGFESLCKRLLTELGLMQLRGVGQAGDRGIDVEGHLRINDVISFRVGVQCKRYADGNKITPAQVRELQGALGPFDRGIFMTTSVFTQQAEDQASSPGYKPIDLIDGERLIELLIEHRLGVRQVRVVDDGFFAPFG